jgi:hypothetical protein
MIEYRKENEAEDGGNDRRGNGINAGDHTVVAS